MAENSEISNSLGELLESHRQSASMTDIILVCEGKEFPAHKMILSMTSNYFRAMFSSEWAESKSNRIELPTVGAKDMELILPFLYTGKMKEVNQQPVLVELFKAAHCLQITALFKQCLMKLCESLKCNNFLEVCNLAFLVSDEEMISLVFSYLAQHFGEVSRSDDFLHLSASQVEKICQHPDTLKNCMDVIINGLFRWTEAGEIRENTLLKILTSLDLKRLSTAFLLGNLREGEFVKKNLHILTLLTAEGTARSLALLSKSIENSKQPKLLYLEENDDAQQVFKMYDINKGEWSVTKILPFKLKYFMSAAWFNGHIYFFGDGECDMGRPSAEVIKYCPTTNTVVSCRPLAIPVCRAGTAVIDEHIYIVGSEDEFCSKFTVQRYNPFTETSEMRAQTNLEYSWPDVLPFGKYLIILEICDKERLIDCYDPESDAWTTITTVPGAMVCSCATIWGKSLVIVSDYLRDAEFHVYDFTSSTWTQLTMERLPKKVRELYSTTIYGKCILLVVDCENTINFYDSSKFIRESTKMMSRPAFFKFSALCAMIDETAAHF